MLTQYNNRSVSVSFEKIPLFCRQLRIKESFKELDNTSAAEQSPLEILLKNLEPDVACEVKTCWIDPRNISFENILGTGNLDSGNYYV